MGEDRRDVRRGRGTSYTLYLADGDPAGLRIVKKDHWTGIAVMCARAQLPEHIGRPEFHRPGVYVLIGQDGEDANRDRVYVGEGDDVSLRLGEHARNKDFWTQVVVFTSSDTTLNKAHVQHIESRLVEILTAAKLATPDNGNTPAPPSLSEVDLARAEGFLEEMLPIYPLLGVNAFAQPRRGPNRAGEITVSPLLTLKMGGCEAKGRDLPEGFVVYAGARGNKEAKPYLHQHLASLRLDLLVHGVLKPDHDFAVLTQDYAFNSPSMAAGILLGYQTNGREAWVTDDGRTLKVLQEEAFKRGLGPK